MKMRKERSHGMIRWTVDLGLVAGQRRRKYFKTEKAARNAIREQLKLRKQAGDVWLALTDDERLDAVRVLRLAQGKNMTLGQVWDGFIAGSTAPVENPITLADALTEMMSAKRAANLRGVYVEALQDTIKHFNKGREQMMTAHIKTKHIEEYLASLKIAVSTKHTAQKRLKTFFAFCLSRKYVKENPVEPIAFPKVDRKTPRIFTPREAAKVLVLCRRRFPRVLGWLVLGMFAGVRPHEIERMTWDAIDLERKTVTINSEVSKVRERRIIKLEPAAVGWLKLAKEMQCVFSFELHHRSAFTAEAARRCGMKRWVQDICRHTAASYLLELRKSVDSVAIELGNSPAILFAHYRDLVREEECKRFWNLLPTRDWRGKKIA